MGVMACGRKGCDSILCKLVILNGTTYLCDRCYFALWEYKKSWNTSTMVVGQVKEKIEKFLKTRPNEQLVENGSPEIDEEFNRLVEREP